MKKNVLFLIMIVISFLNLNCSSDNENSGTSSKLQGKWYFNNPELAGEDGNNSFTFNSNNEVVYTYWQGENFSDYEVGNYSLTDDILTMKFSEDVELVFVQKIVFINDNKVEFVKIEGSNEQAYIGTYYRKID